MSLRIVMMGTGTFATPTFKSLIESSHRIVGLLTQPDRVGRGHHRHPHPMKDLATEHGVPVYQPERVNRTESLEQLRRLKPDLAVVAAYGQILSSELLEIPRLGAVNLHASLLPRHRGAAPVQYAVWQGDVETGVTVFQIEPRLDAGEILGMVRTPIHPEETSGELHDRLATLAAPLCLSTVEQLETGQASGQQQDPSLVTLAPRLSKQDGEVDWTRPADSIECQIRAMQPWPKATTRLEKDGRELRLILLQGRSVTDQSEMEVDPGTIVHVGSTECHVQTGRGILALEQIQLPGKRPMLIRDFLCGHALNAGDRFQSISRSTD